ncbi:gated mechanosensitive channel [Gonapodya prolifera JEL478]|uniref:Gated mechanosensitive channel n=1 Tax=Gonapodya prolifera (strain JEL478) TaxID=1344416 RepID=A0A139A4W8_GONPJ|nr:gated mechanosensitive channel [Gonapodya prolifera JEL478]|eukprot:KXS11830.1 gated mechanosensitive channel [Gonapodya prolifera JEL478]
MSDSDTTPLLASTRAAGSRVVSGARGLYDEFKAFVLRGNVADLAIAVIVGAAFGKVVDSVVTDLFTPFVALFTQQSTLPDANIVLRPGKSGAESYPTLQQARDDGAVTWNYGSFLNVLISFFIVCLIMFLIFKFIVSITPKPAPAAPSALTTAACPACLEDHKIGARLCPHCKWDLRKKLSPAEVHV